MFNDYYKVITIPINSIYININKKKPLSKRYISFVKILIFGEKAIQTNAVHIIINNQQSLYNILAAMDYFKKMTQKTHPVPNQEPSTAARDLVDNQVSRFGVPLDLHSEQRRHFESGVFQLQERLISI